MEDLKYHAITVLELRQRHEESAIKWRRGNDYSFIVTAKLIAKDAAPISILYAINVLEGMQPQWTELNGFIQSEIDRFKTLLMNQL